MGLTKDQEAGAEKIRAFLNSDKKHFLVQGCAGSGKSFMLYHCVKDDPRVAEGRCVGVALSHAAVKVLDNFLNSESKRKIPCYTVASFLGMKPTTDKNGNEIFVRDKKNERPPVTQFDLILFDEASMANREVIKYIRDLTRPLAQVIWIGDAYQLPPIEPKDSKYSGQDSAIFRIKDKAVLTKPIRYDEVVGDAVQIYLDSIDKINSGEGASAYQISQFNYVKQTENSWVEYAKGNSENKLRILQEAITDFIENPLGTRFLAYRRDTVTKMNHFFRSKIYPGAKEYQIGELIIFNAPYETEAEVSITNGTIGKIMNIRDEIVEHCFMSSDGTGEMIVEKFKTNVAVVQDAVTGEIYYDVKLIALSNKFEFQKCVQNLFNRAKKRDGVTFSDAFELRDSVANTDSSFCTTAHKVQGSSLDNVYVAMADIFGVGPISTKNKCQAAYVATTRTKSKIKVIY